MSRVPARRDRDWPHILRAPAQPAEIVPAFPKNPPTLNPEKYQLFQKYGTSGMLYHSRG
jgi:hypothetical protein